MSQQPPPVSPATEPVKSSFENFLINWIDNDRLDTAINIAKHHPWLVKASTWTAGIPASPKITVLQEHFGTLSSSVIARDICKFKDELMDYVIFIFEYYGYTFETESGETIFEVCTKIQDGKKVPDYDKIMSENNEIMSENNEIRREKKFKNQIGLAWRLRKIYKIITKYMIGFYDLSDHKVRLESGIQTKHRDIFIIGENNDDKGVFSSEGVFSFVGNLFRFNCRPGQTPQPEAQEIEQSALSRNGSNGSTCSTGSTGSDFVFFPGGNTQKRHKRKIRRTRKRRH